MQPTGTTRAYSGQSSVRAVFWIAGISCGIVLAYTTRFFINGDAMAYIEMAEALRNCRWDALANLTYSPGYPVILAAAQFLLQTDPMNELQVLRVANVVCLLTAMGACEFLMRGVRPYLSALSRRPSRLFMVGQASRLSGLSRKTSQEDRQDACPTIAREVLHHETNRDGEEPLPVPLVDALAYGMFLVASLVMVRVRLLNPDMLILAIVVLCAGILLRIREQPERFAWYAVLGAMCGAGYLVKSFFFTFAPVFFVMAGLCAASLKKAVQRVIVSMVVMLLVASPLIALLSHKAGRITYGELGKLAYAQFISGEGEPFRPQRLHDAPAVFLYRSDTPETRPSGYDIAYWQEGFRPRIDMAAHAKLIAANVADFAGQVPWVALIVVWFGLMGWAGAVRLGSLHPPSPFFLLMLPALAGIGFYLLVHVESRYAGSFFFLAFVAMVSSLRRGSDTFSVRFTSAAGWVLVCFFCGLVVHSGIDQSVRGLWTTGGKLSYQDAFREHVMVKDRLAAVGLGPGDEVGVIGAPPVNWARMARAKVTAEAPDADAFLASSTEARAAALDALRGAGIKAVVVKGGAFTRLAGEGWRLVGGTQDYYLLGLSSRSE